MEKPGLEHAVMIFGAGISMLHMLKNVNFVKYYKKDRPLAAQRTNFSGMLESISNWTVRVIMFLILLSNSYQLFFSGITNGRLVYCFGIGLSALYFVFFAGFTVKVNMPGFQENIVK